MHYRRFVSFVLGAWLACSVLMVVVTIQMRDVNDLVQNPPPDIEQLVKSVKGDNARALLRYGSWTTASSFFYGWGLTQIPLAILAAWLLLLSTHRNRMGVGAVFAMLLLACFTQFVVGPELAYVGQTLDLGSVRAGGRGRYFVLHVLYLVMEALKIAIGLVLTAYLFRYRADKPEAADSALAGDKPASGSDLLVCGNRGDRSQPSFRFRISFTVLGLA